MILGALAIALGIWMVLSLNKEKRTDALSVFAYGFAYIGSLACFLVGVLAISGEIAKTETAIQKRTNSSAGRAISPKSATVPGSGADYVLLTEVNYSAPVEWLMENDRYSWRNPKINSQNFPGGRAGVQIVEMQVISFTRSMATAEVFRELNRLGLWPANAHELLTFKLRTPNLKFFKEIVALGSYYETYDGKVLAPLVYRENNSDVLNLRPVTLRWTTDHCFLAIKQ